jgi:hypothetical protein
VAGHGKAAAQERRVALQELARSLRNDIPQLEDEREQALFETTAEVLEGLIRAFSHFASESEEAWRDSS